MHGKIPSNNNRDNKNRHTPAFSVQDEIRRNRRLEQNKRIRQARATRRKAFAILLCVAVLLITVTAVLLTVMRIRTVSVSGNSRYSADEILEAAEIDGDILPLVGDDSVYKRVVAVCPYVNGIELKKTYPSTVEIIVTEAEAVYYADIHDRRYSLDSSLRVIEFTDDPSGLVRLILPEVKSVIEGSRIKFAEERYDELIPKLLDTVFYGDVVLPFSALDVSNRFSIHGIVGDSAKINFGDYNDMALKLSAAERLLQKAEEQHSQRTFVNVSTLSGVGPSMILDYEGEF